MEKGRRCYNEEFNRSTIKLVTASLKTVIGRGENPELIFHLERGSQYVSGKISDYLKNHDMIQSINGKVNYYDNQLLNLMCGKWVKNNDINLPIMQ